jgi:hypothetical protein
MVVPKGRGSWTPCSFSLQIRRFLGVRNGSHDAVPGPSPIARHSSAISVGVAVMGARAMPPFVAVLLASAKADEPIAAPKGARITDQTFPPANLPPLWQYFSVSPGVWARIGHRG